MTQSTADLVSYYANLLIRQYITQTKAVATVETVVAPIIMPQVSVQTITFPVAPTSGSFILSYGGSQTTPINWNDSAATIQAKLRLLPPEVIFGGTSSTSSFLISFFGGNAGTTIFQQDIDGGDAFGWGLSSIVVTGSISSLLLTVTFIGIPPPAALLQLVSTSLMASGNLVTPVITETDLTLPLAVQAGYNITGPNPAVGKQLDVLGKYVGASRTSRGFTTQITLDDVDFLSLIQMAITINNSGSSLATIQQQLHQFFPNEILVFDYKDMTMSYLISEAVGSQELIQVFIEEGFLPRPMTVRIRVVIYAPTIDNFFGFRTYELPAFNASPFNSYTDYEMDRPWLSYADAIIPP